MNNVKWRLAGWRICIPGILAVLFFCSCATTRQTSGNKPAPALPPDASFNKGAGRGNKLYLTLHMKSGEKLLFSVDTGAPDTVLDKSLEPKLGRRLGLAPIWYGYFRPAWGNIYRAPELYLGNTRLMTSDRIHTDDLRTKSGLGRPIMGILGMDCLKHYCLQLDFDTDTIHFVDPDRLKTDGLGKAFPLTINTWGAVLIRTDFFGISNANFWLDTADYFDGAFSAGPFNRQLAKQKPNFTNHWKAPNGIVFARFPEVEFAGQTYTNLLLHRCPRMLSLVHPKIIGLRFLARHRVTFNFPKRMMYLQQRSVGPLPDGMAALMESLGCLDGKPPKDLEARIKTLAKQRPVLRRYLDGDEFLSSLKKKGQLPGWLKDETRYTQFRPDADLAFEWEQTTEPDDYPVAQTLALSKKSDSSIYQYTVIKASKDAPWQLQRAWKAAPTGRIRKDYPVP